MKVKSLYTNSTSHGYYDPLSYLLIFLYGEDGWHYRMHPRTAETDEREESVSRVTLLLFYSYKLFQEPDSLNSLHRDGRLFQQHIIDQFCNVETYRL